MRVDDDVRPLLNWVEILRNSFLCQWVGSRHRVMLRLGQFQRFLHSLHPLRFSHCFARWGGRWRSCPRAVSACDDDGSALALRGLGAQFSRTGRNGMVPSGGRWPRKRRIGRGAHSSEQIPAWVRSGVVLRVCGRVDPATRKFRKQIRRFPLGPFSDRPGNVRSLNCYVTHITGEGGGGDAFR